MIAPVQQEVASPSPAKRPRKLFSFGSSTQSPGPSVVQAHYESLFVEFKKFYEVCRLNDDLKTAQFWQMHKNVSFNWYSNLFQLPTFRTIRKSMILPSVCFLFQQLRLPLSVSSHSWQFTRSVTNPTQNLNWFSERFFRHSTTNSYDCSILLTSTFALWL